MRTLQRRTGAATLLAATAGAMVLIPGTARGEVTSLGFTATAASDPFRISTLIKNFPAFENPVDSGGPSAQVALSTSEGGLAYSAAPDPGVFLTVLPQLGAGVLDQNGVKLPFGAPDYPFAVRADPQAPSKRVGAGGYELAADVTPVSAESRTKTGGETPGGNLALVDANAQIVQTAQGVAAKAIADIQGLTIGPLSFASVRSVASVLSDPSGNLTRSSSFSVDGMKIGSLPVGLAPGGFTVAGTMVPADQQAIFNGLLETGGVSLEQFPQMETKNGLIGSGLVITQKFDTPSLGATTVRYRVGGVAVDLNSGAEGAGGSVPAISTGTTPAIGGSSAPVDSVTAVPDLGAAPLPVGDVPQAVGVPATTAVGPAGTTGVGVPVVQLAPVSSVRLPERVEGNLYLVIVLAGVLGFGVTRVIRMTG